MGKSNKERQADFRMRMKAEGKQALPLWVTPQQAEQIRALLNPTATPPAQAILLPVTKPAAPLKSSLLVTGQREAFAVPALPANMPEPFVRDIRETETRAKKKRAQIQKLETEVAGIEKWILKTVAEWKRIELVPPSKPIAPLPVTATPAAPVTSNKSRKKKAPIDPIAEANKRIVKEQWEEIKSRNLAGAKPSELAAWLKKEFDFQGTGATLNGLALEPLVMVRKF